MAEDPQPETSPRITWRQLLTHPQIVTILLLLGGGSAVVYFFAFQILPFVAAIIIAYFLNHGVRWVQEHGVPRWAALTAVYLLFLAAYMVLLVVPLPIVLRRAVEIVQALPASPEELLSRLPDVPAFAEGWLDEEQKANLVSFVLGQTRQALEVLAYGSLQVLPQITTWLVYLVLVPLLAFFFLKDKDAFIAGLQRILPRERRLAGNIWREMEDKMANYVAGKFVEMVIVGLVTWVVFLLLGFAYPMVLGLVSGISVLVPYVGALAVTVPVAITGYLQWGASAELVWLLVAYTIIQMLDGNLLNPLIFSEAVKLHPVTILLAVLLFGSLWGVWGVFFAIPLATLLKALLNTLLDFRNGDVN